MRVISGKYKGSKIEGFKIEGTRPTMDRVKESMFAMIQTHMKGSIVLDLFAGSGNLGIEALSNGALKVYFVDQNKIATKTMEQNIKKLKAEEQCHILQADYQEALKQFSKLNIKFDLVLLDPPYQAHFINTVLKQLISLQLLKDNALIVCEYEQEEVWNEGLKCVKEKKYGTKFVKIYQFLQDESI